MPKIHRSTRGMNAEMTKPMSIMESVKKAFFYCGDARQVNRCDILVAKANHLFCVFLATPSSSDCSDAATDPQGYSAPTPMPSRNLAVRESGLDLP
jgi:hypothetical protein